MGRAGIQQAAGPARDRRRRGRGHGMSRQRSTADDPLFTIGQMAKLNAVSEKALRVYQHKGILEPARVDEETGYRYYTLDQCAMLDMIQQLRVLGFTLDQIAEILREGDVAYLRDRVREHVRRVEQRQRELAMAHQIGGDLLRSCEAYLNKPPCGEYLLCTLPERSILEFPVVETVADPETDGRKAIASWEVALRSIRRAIAQSGRPLALFRNVGCIVAREDLARGAIRYDRAFVFVPPAFGEELYREARRIPSATYLVEYLDGVLTENGGERETVELARMLDYCERTGLEVAGDYLGEVIADGPAFLFEGREMLFRLCLPVRLKGQPSWEMPSQRAAMASWREDSRTGRGEPSRGRPAGRARPVGP